jgi:hypothetical protein
MAEKDAEAAQAEARENNAAPVLQGLAAHVMSKWSDARDAKQSVLPRLQAAARARQGRYSAAKLAEIAEFGGSKTYFRLIAKKCMVLSALLKDVYLGQTDKPWTLAPTPDPDFPDDVEQEITAQLAQEIAAVYAATGVMPDQTAIAAAQAELRNQAEERIFDAVRASVERMEKRMADQLAEGKFHSTMSAFLDEFTTYPAAFLKGPVLYKRKQLTWSKAEGKTEPVVEEDIVPEFDVIPAFRAYPAPGAKTTQDGYFIEHLSLGYDDLYDMIGSPGVDEEAVRAVLREADNGGMSDWMGWASTSDEPDLDNVSEQLKEKTHDIDCLQYWGPVKGKDLLSWDTDGDIGDEIEDPEASYESCVWLIGSWIIKAHLNYDPLGIRPVFNASYKNIPNTLWGEAVPDLLEDIAGDDGVLQVATRSMNNNMAMASGPMVGVNVDRLADGETIETIRPWKQFQTKDAPYGNNADRPIEWFQPHMHAQEILTVIDKFLVYADSFSMIPRSAAGDTPTGGVGRTASGFALQLDAAGKGLKDAVLNVDQALAQLLRKLFNHNMVFDTDETIKSDAQIIPRGAVGLMQIESLRMRRNEFLRVTNNPTDLQITGIEGRAHVLRETAKDLDMDVTKIFPKGGQPAAGQPGPEPAAMPQQQAQQGGVQEGQTLANGAPVHDTFSPMPDVAP